MASNNKTKQDRQALAATNETLKKLSEEQRTLIERAEAFAKVCVTSAEQASDLAGQAEKARTSCAEQCSLAIGAAECARDFCRCARAYKIVQALMFWVTLCATLAYLTILFYSLS